MFLFTLSLVLVVFLAYRLHREQQSINAWVAYCDRLEEHLQDAREHTQMLDSLQLATIDAWRQKYTKLQAENMRLKAQIAAKPKVQPNKNNHKPEKSMEGKTISIDDSLAVLGELDQRESELVTKWQNKGTNTFVIVDRIKKRRAQMASKAKVTV